MDYSGFFLPTKINLKSWISKCFRRTTAFNWWRKLPSKLHLNGFELCQKRAKAKKCQKVIWILPSTHHSMQMKAINRGSVSLFYTLGLERRIRLATLCFSFKGWCSFKSLWIPKSSCFCEALLPFKYKKDISKIYYCIEGRELNRNHFLESHKAKIDNFTFDLTVKMGRKEW